MHTSCAYMHTLVMYAPKIAAYMHTYIYRMYVCMQMGASVSLKPICYARIERAARRLITVK